MYYALMFVACLNAQCEVRTIDVEPKHKYGCMVVAPFQLRDWEAAHPGWTIRGYMCVPARPFK